MDEKEITSPEESLAIIEGMIAAAKRKVADNSFLFLLWGWLLFITTVTQFVLKVLLGYLHHYYVWAIMYSLLIILIVPVGRRITGRMPRSYLDDIIRNLWAGMILSYVLLTCIFFKIGWDHCYTFYILLMALGCFLGWKLLVFPPLAVAATICGFMTLLSTFLTFDQDILLCGIAILTSYIIPGYMLRVRHKKNAIAAGIKQ